MLLMEQSLCRNYVDIDAAIEKFYGSEPISSAKKFARIVGLKDRSKEIDFILGFAYARRIDDCIDSGSDPVLAGRVIEEHERNLNAIISNGGVVPYDEDSAILGRLYSSYGPGILESFLGLFYGFRVDNYIISTGKPVCKDMLDKRHLSQNLSAFQLMNIVNSGKELKYSEDFKDLVKVWTTYDAIIDFKEDLESGLILFSEEELHERDIRFRIGENIPEKFGYFLHEKRKEVTKGLLAKAHSVDETNFGFAEKLMLKAYFRSRVIKLARKDLCPDGIIYHANGSMYDMPYPDFCPDFCPDF